MEKILRVVVSSFLPGNIEQEQVMREHEWLLLIAAGDSCQKKRSLFIA